MSRLKSLLRAGLLGLAEMTSAAAPSGLRPSLNLYAFLLRMGDQPQILDMPPPVRQVLVLAPHPDDETIGCGGVIKHYTAAGTPVTVIVVSDGSRGGLAAQRGELVAQRRVEASKAADLLGVKSLIFMDLSDGNVRPEPRAIDQLRRELERLQPDIVLLPFVLDQHPDHLQTVAILLAAMAPLTKAGKELICWGYETRTPLYANRVVDITRVADAKWAALEVYTSQTTLDYVSTTRGLNSFRWLHTFKGSGYAEAFYACSLAEYRQLYDLIRS